MIESKRVLILGGYGGFGTRLATRLAREGWTVLIAGRDGEAAKRLAERLPRALGVMLDRDKDLSAALKEHRPAVLVDAAGPFQGSDYHVAQACITAGIAYIDLADARAFVCGIDALDGSARETGVPVVTGASSVPALSGAVLRDLTRDMRLRSVAMSISASNRASAGRSVARAILSYAGQPIRLWSGRRWNIAYGLQPVRKADYYIEGLPPLRRHVALADVPDHDLVPARFTGQPAVRFEAGPEFTFQIVGLSLLGWLVRWRLVSSLSALAPLLLPLQRLTGRGGSERSAMVVEAKGLDPEGAMCVARWTLIADRGDGPEIPVLAAQLLCRKLAEGELETGARDASALLTLADFEPLLSALAIRHDTIRQPYTPLYRRVMGGEFDKLPNRVRMMHDVIGDGGASGEATVKRGPSLFAAAIGAIMRFPPTGIHSLHVAFEEHRGRESWRRSFGAHAFQSELSADGDLLVERFGPLRFHFELPRTDDGLEMVMRRWSLFRIPLPLFLAPRSHAREWEADDRFWFDVPISLPLIGLVVHYRGWLEPA